MPSLETYESPRSRLLARLGVRGPQEMRLVGPASAHPDHALRPHLEAARRVRQPRGEEDVHLPRKGQAAAAALLRDGCGAGVRRVRRQRRRLCRRRPLVAREEETRVDGARPGEAESGHAQGVAPAAQTRLRLGGRDRGGGRRVERLVGHLVDDEDCDVEGVRELAEARRQAEELAGALVRGCGARASLLVRGAEEPGHGVNHNEPHLFRPQPLGVLERLPEGVGRVELHHVHERHEQPGRRAERCVLGGEGVRQLFEPLHGCEVRGGVGVQEDRAAAEPADGGRQLRLQHALQHELRLARPRRAGNLGEAVRVEAAAEARVDACAASGEATRVARIALEEEGRLRRSGCH
mmetsp:Transcript_19567/g.63982  ORF Transcript_19567/g.63982 Transcript_19567/m.63982 type:complete len:351 (-) Transcript_19567:10-1062(-)